MFRVDIRNYKPNDTILPKTTYDRELTDEKLEIEQVLNQLRPYNIPERNKCLFLFDSLLNAIKFYLRYGGTIYRVKPNHIYHRGDMNKLDNILDVFRFSEDRDLRNAVVNEYWKLGTQTFMPCYEFLVPSAIVKDTLLTNDNLEEVKAELKKYRSIENTSTYRRLLERITSD